jgi:transcriptional regulator with XRE-family HTH domain
MMSQEALSLAADVDVSYVGRVERGNNNVAILTLLKLTKALELTLAQLAAAAEL